MGNNKCIWLFDFLDFREKDCKYYLFQVISLPMHGILKLPICVYTIENSMYIVLTSSVNIFLIYFSSGRKVEFKKVAEKSDIQI